MLHESCVRDKACACAVVLLFLSACGGSSGGGSSGAFASRAQLTAILFPDPNEQNPEPIDEPPLDAPLNQQVQFVFSGAPNPAQVNGQRLSIRDRSGFPVPGRFEVDGNVVTFTPDLPTRGAVQQSSSVWDTGGSGTQPGTFYSVRAGPALWPEFVSSLGAGLRNRFADPSGADSVVLGLRTTTGPNRFFKGLAKRNPRLIEVSPSDGSVVSPNLYTDPDDLFPETVPYVLDFDAAIHPDPVHLDAFAFVDLDDTTLGPAGLPLGIEVTVLQNEVDFARVEVKPTGILFPGHNVSLEIPTDVRGLSQTPMSAPGNRVAATYVTASTTAAIVRDVLHEDFEDRSRREQDPGQVPVGQVPAAWDDQNSGVLEAGFEFEGTGVLGRFAPDPNAVSVVTLDTSNQVFPLSNGATPDAPPGFSVLGGVFEFTTIDIPVGVTIQAIGPNPLVFTATGSVRIAGVIDVNGGEGTQEWARDSGVTPLPGGKPGPGGGRGGEGHPILYVGLAASPLTLVSPPFGGRGFGPPGQGRIGGFGGQCGILDNPDANGDFGTDHEIDCDEGPVAHFNGYRGSGGGGGSFGRPGKVARTPGVGNVLADGLGGWIVRTPQTHGANYMDLQPGAPGDPVFRDADPDNDFIGIRGEIQRVMGGQGGGAGSSTLDAYFCGEWCLIDTDASNDAICFNDGKGLRSPEFGFPPRWAGSVGDSRGGAGGGGGGAFSCDALGPITVESTATVTALGGNGGGGESLSCGQWSGCGGGAAGGAILMNSAVGIVVEPGAWISVKGGRGKQSGDDDHWAGGCNRGKKHAGSGGDGGDGIIQFRVPLGQTANVDPAAIDPPDAWLDPDNTLNPAEFGPLSVGQSQWYDMGRTIARGGGAPRFELRGLDAAGFVMTDATGDVINPAGSDIRCDYLGQLDPLNPGQYLPGEEPRANHIPPNATVRVEFQAANSVTPGSKEVDPASIIPGSGLWSPSPAIADGMQFVRYRVTFDLDAGGAGQVAPGTPRPAVQWLDLRSDF